MRKHTAWVRSVIMKEDDCVAPWTQKEEMGEGMRNKYDTCVEESDMRTSQLFRDVRTR